MLCLAINPISTETKSGAHPALSPFKATKMANVIEAILQLFTGPRELWAFAAGR